MKYKNLDAAKSVRLARDEADWLSAVAEQQRRPESEIVRAALRQWCAQQEATPARRAMLDELNRSYQPTGTGDRK